MYVHKWVCHRSNSTDGGSLRGTLRVKLSMCDYSNTVFANCFPCNTNEVNNIGYCQFVKYDLPFLKT